MSSAIPTLQEINRNVYIYGGPTVVILGTVGNILTLLVFSQNPLRSTRTAPYIMLLAVLSTIYLDCNVIPRFLVTLWRQTDTAFGYDIVCRLRSLILWSCVTVVMLLLPYLAFDRYSYFMVARKTSFLCFRYLCSCRQASRRAWSTSRVLRHATIAIVAFALLINWPYLIYCRMAFNPISRLTGCTIQDPTLLQFYVSTSALLPCG